MDLLFLKINYTRRFALVKLKKDLDVYYQYELVGTTNYINYNEINDTYFIIKLQVDDAI